MSPETQPVWDREKIARELDRLAWTLSDALNDCREATSGLEHPLVRSAIQQTDLLRAQVADYARLTRQGVQGVAAP